MSVLSNETVYGSAVLNNAFTLGFNITMQTNPAENYKYNHLDYTKKITTFTLNS